MKILTLLFLIVTLLIFSAYFYLIEPLIGHYSWLAFVVFLAIFISLNYIQRKLDSPHVEFFQKRIDKKLSLIIVIFLFFIFIVASLWF